MKKTKTYTCLLILLCLLTWKGFSFAETLSFDEYLAFDNSVASRWYFVAYIDQQNNIQILGDNPREIANKNIIKLAANYDDCFYQTQDYAIRVQGHNNGTLVEYLPDVKQLVTTDGDAFALMEDGTVLLLYSCNKTINELPYSEFDRWEDIVYLTAGRNFLIGLRRDGTVVVDGDTVLINKRKVRKWKNVKQIHAGAANVIALTYDNEIMFDNSYYNLTKDEYTIPKKKIDFSSWTDVVQVTAGHNFAAGLRSDGTIVLAGWEEYYINEYRMDHALNWTDIVYIEAYQDCLIGVKADGQIVAMVAPLKGYDILDEEKKYILLTK